MIYYKIAFSFWQFYYKIAFFKEVCICRLNFFHKIRIEEENTQDNTQVNFSYSTSLPSGIFEIIVLLILIKNNVETVNDITSAIGKAHHTA